MANDNSSKVQAALDSLLDAKQDALPMDFRKSRFSENCKAYVREYSDLHRFTADDIALALFKGAVLGLDFLAKECHLIVEGGAVRFQTDYKGEMKLVKKYSVRPILDIYAKNVREGDAFQERIESGRPVIDFNPIPFNASEITGTFAIALFEDGGMIYETMPAKEIESIRTNYGRNPGSDTWDKSQGEMYKRTALRRLCKTIEVDFDVEQRIAFEAGSAFDVRREQRPKQQSPLNIASEGDSDETDQG